MKALTFVFTALINLGIGAAWFFMLLLSLNGFTSKQAESGLILFIVWAVLTAILVGVFGYFSAGHFIEKKSLNAPFAAFATTVVFVIVGAAIDFIGFLVAVSLTTARRLETL